MNALSNSANSKMVILTAITMPQSSKERGSVPKTFCTHALVRELIERETLSKEEIEELLKQFPPEKDGKEQQRGEI